MLVTANVSFAGLITMFGGEERDITDEQVVKDLLGCGYVTPVGGAEQEADAGTESDTEQESSGKAETGRESAEDEDKRTSKRSH